jgi:chromosome segregation ATPase
VNRPSIVIAAATGSLLLLLAGCATMAGWVGIASKAQVQEVGDRTAAAETRLLAAETRLTAANAEIDRLGAQLEEYKARAGRLESLTAELDQTIRSTRRLEELAKVLEARLEELPGDTLRLLAEIIQKHLPSAQTTP